MFQNKCPFYGTIKKHLYFDRSFVGQVLLVLANVTVTERIFGIIVYMCVFCGIFYACERIMYDYDYFDDES